MKVFSPLIYKLSYIILISIALGVFYVFRPYSYVDNSKSTVVCLKDGKSYEIGWNFIYTFEDKLDSFNDIKARKICEYQAIKDYGNTLNTPASVNYQFVPILIQESSWADAIFMFFATFIMGGILIELITKLSSSILTRKISSGIFLLSTVIFVPLLFFLIIKKPADIIFCKRQVARKVNGFKRIIFKYGLFEIPEEDVHIKSVIPGIYKKCMDLQT